MLATPPAGSSLANGDGARPWPRRAAIGLRRPTAAIEPDASTTKTVCWARATSVVRAGWATARARSDDGEELQEQQPRSAAGAATDGPPRPAATPRRHRNVEDTSLRQPAGPEDVQRQDRDGQQQQPQRSRVQEGHATTRSRRGAVTAVIARRPGRATSRGGGGRGRRRRAGGRRPRPPGGSARRRRSAHASATCSYAPDGLGRQADTATVRAGLAVDEVEVADQGAGAAPRRSSTCTTTTSPPRAGRRAMPCCHSGVSRSEMTTVTPGGPGRASRCPQAAAKRVSPPASSPSR